MKKYFTETLESNILQHTSRVALKRTYTIYVLQQTNDLPLLTVGATCHTGRLPYQSLCQIYDFKA